ncbi:MAG: methylenetetrahydrofolate--tRNA-(uracil(54)-C(5))-methyltransferase (FADH(2)-oxidizing) TrmFO [Eubacteriales bacterium]|nr:methylenetetrahydrofolate--tRNA-(uracil(54)-C(5))-methyltransferase (FADH(2)-oxidizing) TrmFO [Eubacteriales bacterium]
MTKNNAVVIGAGLAGCEAAYQLVRHGVSVTLYEQKPLAFSPAHHSGMFAELVCSNSFRADGLLNAVGLLKQEMREMGSLVMRAADATSVAAGGALAVDRNKFSGFVTQAIAQNAHIHIVREEVTALPEDGTVIVAAGPLVSGPLAENIAEKTGGMLSFFDAAAPIVTAESIDMDKAFYASRYGRGSDYINCAMDEAQYRAFYGALVGADTAELHGFEDAKVFEGCMPVETMAKRGYQTLLYGPLKPVGLSYPGTDKMPFAVVQLRREDDEGRLFNIVGFQTHLKFGEQKRVFSMIPGLENAAFMRYGVMHRNTYIKSPGVLNEYYEMKSRPGLFVAGQLSGVEGYIESASSGMLAGVFAACDLTGLERPRFSRSTACGALAAYVSGYAGADFQPMNINFGIMNTIELRASKKDKKLAVSQRALNEIREIRAAYKTEGSL